MSKPINGVEPKEWAKHLRPYGKRQFWKAHRQSEIEDAEFRGRKKKRKKLYGLKIDYKFSFFYGSHTNWYETEKARDAAMKKLGGVKIEKQRPVGATG